MKSHSITHILLSFCLCFFCACTKEETAVPVQEEQPVVFEMIFPADGIVTRATADVDGLYPVAEKKAFIEGDVIHVSAVFTLTDGNTEIRYGFLKLEGSGIWMSGGTGSNMRWPVDAATGVFTAYYIPTSNGEIADGDAMEMPLGGEYTLSDPLAGVSALQPYGHAVSIRFGHLATRLILTDVPEEHDEFWMTEKNNSPEKIRNAYRLEHNPDHTLTLEFYSDPTLNTGAVSASKDPDFGNRVSFHLAPGNYNGVNINYRNNLPYLTMNVNDLENMQAGESYAISITDTPGVVEQPDTEDPWGTDTDTEIFDSIDDINRFIEAVNGNKEYILDNGTEILTKSKSGSLILMKDIDFSGLGGYDELNIPSAVVLNGNNHIIRNFKQPIFSRIDGKVYNLGLEDAEIEDQDGTATAGALAKELYSKAVVDNIMLKDIRITIGVGQYSINNTQGGALFGYSQGTASNILLRGNITVRSTNVEGLLQADETNFLGGVIGQLAGSLSGVRLDEGATLTVSNDDTGHGVSNIGGVVGYVAGSCSVSDCSLTVTVDNSQSTGYICYTGGIAGRIDGSITGCNVAGTVKGGNCENIGGDNVSLAVTGGLVGNITRNTEAGLSDCNSTAAVEGYAQFEGVDGTYGSRAYTGGAVGLSYCSASQMSDCIAWGNVTGAAGDKLSYVGYFAGGTVSSETEVMAQDNQASAEPYVGKDNIVLPVE